MRMGVVSGPHTNSEKQTKDFFFKLIFNKPNGKSLPNKLKILNTILKS